LFHYIEEGIWGFKDSPKESKTGKFKAIIATPVGTYKQVIFSPCGRYIAALVTTPLPGIHIYDLSSETPT
jgi:hypothetical protein